jgi:hypothetical protein
MEGKMSRSTDWYINCAERYNRIIYIYIGTVILNFQISFISSLKYCKFIQVRTVD